ncbi:hypothetical protein [Streptomyces sp. NPDC000618]|uniref:hypothetical protein n=1 Tax=Streptomyces sp. NPDC000618 TaxID=3154265 RepID=UPI0033232C96
MSTLALLVVLLLVLVVLLTVGAVVYLVHRRPALNGPVTAGVTTVTALAAVLAVVLSAGGGRAGPGHRGAPAPHGPGLCHLCHRSAVSPGAHTGNRRGPATGGPTTACPVVVEALR